MKGVLLALCVSMVIGMACSVSLEMGKETFGFPKATPLPKNVEQLAPWTPIDWTTLPKANPGDFIEIYYLVAPLMEDEVGPLFGALDLFHAAIAFHNIPSQLVITINYDAFDFVHASMFPIINTTANGTTVLNWRNGGANFIYMGINETYWTKSLDMIGITTGAVYNEFISTYNANINTTQPYYDMFSLLNQFNGTLYVDGYDCFDFAINSLNWLAQNGAQFDPSYVLYRDDANLYTSIPPINLTKAYLNDPSITKQVNEFYQLIEGNANMSILDLLVTIFDSLEGTFFVREATDYWQIDLKLPWFGLDWVPVPFPSKSN